MTTMVLLGILGGLLLVSGFFSGTETGMMSLNRYRLRHLARKKNKSARRVKDLLAKPDRLLGVILIGNTFANIMASAVATLIAVRLMGDIGIAVASILLTLIVLIFAEITPKTLAALHPERVAFPASYVLAFLLRILYPLVWLAIGVSNGILKLLGVKSRRLGSESLTSEELRTVVYETAGKISPGYQQMMVSILDLGKVTVDDIVIPRNEVLGIDLNNGWSDILDQLTSVQHTKLPVYREEIDNVQGVLHVRDAMKLLAKDKLNKAALIKALRPVYFIPEATPLSVQLFNFQREQRRMGLVVDEYGEIQGLVTLEDILEEIVGEFTTTITPVGHQIENQKDGSYLIDGSVSVRELNRLLGWHLPTDGPKTLSGLVVEYLQTLPKAGIGLRIGGYAIEIIAVNENLVKLAKVYGKVAADSTDAIEAVKPSKSGL